MEYKVQDLTGIAIMEEILFKNIHQLQKNKFTEEEFIKTTTQSFEEFSDFLHIHHKKVFNYEIETNNIIRNLRKEINNLDEINKTPESMKQILDRLFLDDEVL